MLQKIYAEYSMLAVTVTLGIVLIFGGLILSVTDLGEGLMNFIEAFNN